MLLEDLAALIAGAGVHPEALLQLDYKEDAAALTPRAIATFAGALDGVAAHVILSSGDPEAVRLLAAGVPGLRVGHDPCHEDAIGRLMTTRDYAGFVAEAVAASPDAELIYLDHRLVLWARDDGFDLVGAFHAAGRRVDAYTIPRADGPGLAAARRLLDLGVDQITTDDPEGLGAALPS
jgi:glycerophosphoryl diester phosphodiesterase